MPVQLIAAPHTAFDADGALNLATVAEQAAHLQATGVSGAFVCGSTGEGVSLTVDERLLLTDRWVAAGKATGLQVIIHVGHNCQADAIRLAAHAAEAGADAISSMAPHYFKPESAAQLIDFLEPIASAGGQLPFYFYDIPGLTGVAISTVEFLRSGADRLPNLAGVKYTNPDLVQFQECLRLAAGRFTIWFGCDEALLAGYALGATGAVGSTYNFAAPLYQQMIAAYDAGDAEMARDLQQQSIQLIRVCQRYGFPAAAKYAMSLRGIDCGPVRSPLQNLSPAQKESLHEQLAQLALFAPNQ